MNTWLNRGASGGLAGALECEDKSEGILSSSDTGLPLTGVGVLHRTGISGAFESQSLVVLNRNAWRFSAEYARGLPVNLLAELSAGELAPNAPPTAGDDFSDSHELFMAMARLAS